MTPKHPLIADLEAGNLKKFYQRELKTRKELGYPPFSTLVKLTYTSKSVAKTGLEAEKLGEKLLAVSTKQLAIEVSPPYEPYSKTPRKIRLNMAIKIESNPNIEQDLDKLSKLISTDWRVEVDPESLL
jgi:primosomal protein N' (replication factor Y)